MIHTKTKKTNKQWYPYKDMGDYYRLEEGELLFSPMMEDGTIDMDGKEVNFGVVGYIEDQDQARMAEIVKELEEKE